jgi:hypothetical protein
MENTMGTTTGEEKITGNITSLISTAKKIMAMDTKEVITI